MERHQIEALLEDRRKYDVKEMQKCVSNPFDVALALAYVRRLHKTFKESAIQIDLRPFPNPAQFSPQCLIQPWAELYEPLINKKLRKRDGISTPFMPYFLAALDGRRCSKSCSVLSAYDTNPLELYHTFAAMDPELKGQFDENRTRAAMRMYFKHTTNFSNYVNALPGINVIEQPPRAGDVIFVSTATDSASEETLCDIPDLPRISSRGFDELSKISPYKPEIKEHIDNSECRPLNYREEVTNEDCKTPLQLSWPLISVEKLIAYLGAGKIQDDGSFYIRAANSFSTLWRWVLVYCLN
ncbi:hypothetical protein BDQ12DRAFT_708844 [Crucibulum laeve]|uniref:Uncharacterized protein n=1 Tax=Crucibulum laeve TaxID=68775 RepID=A0A5C3MM96_9AGAR|nr:hypothetical protein BDQ12DRAFT_708844 [Crucibulum laeve]